MFNFGKQYSGTGTSLRFPGTRSISVLLSISFIWLFVACVSLCSIHCARIHETDGAAWSHMIDDSQESDCCPVTNSPDAALSGRWLFAQPPSRDQLSTVIISEHFLSQLRQRRAIRFVQYPSSDPPFDRLFTLRV